MKNLEHIDEIFLIRHGEALGFAASDELRPLTQRGRLQAQEAGSSWEIRRAHHQPSFVFVSSALRTEETWQVMVSCIQEPSSAVHMIKRPDLYLAPLDQLRSVLYEADLIQSEEAISVVIIGHNPGLSMLSMDLGGPNYLDTGSIVHLRRSPVTLDWTAIS